MGRRHDLPEASDQPNPNVGCGLVQKGLIAMDTATPNTRDSAAEVCVLCGHRADLVEAQRNVTVRGRSVRVAEEFWRCAKCGEEHLTPQQMRESQQRAVEVICRHEGLLHGHEIRALREGFGLTQAELESLLGVGPKTVVRWERGTVFQSRSVDTLLRVLRDHPEVTRELAQQRRIELQPS